MALFDYYYFDQMASLEADKLRPFIARGRPCLEEEAVNLFYREFGM